MTGTQMRELKAGDIIYYREKHGEFEFEHALLKVNEKGSNITISGWWNISGNHVYAYELDDKFVTYNWEIGPRVVAVISKPHMAYLNDTEKNLAFKKKLVTRLFTDEPKWIEKE